MANLDNVKDDGLKARLAEAHSQLRAGKSTEAVHSLADAFLAMLTMRPDLKSATVAGRRGPMPLVSMWPRLGADLSVEEAGPKIEFTRDRFAMSEAFTYYEFTVDTAVNQGL